jgi:hypothetical protein
VGFSDAGTYILRIEATGNGSYTSDEVTITVNDTYDAWAARYGAGLPEENDDQDCLTNLLEYALDLDPAVFDTQAFLVDPMGSDLVFSYTQSLRKIDITYQAQVSSDLSRWDPAIVETVPGFTVDADLVNTSGPANGGARFWRLLVKRPR